MSDEPSTPGAADEDILPFEDGPTKGLVDDDVVFGPGTFYYIGEGLTNSQFRDYVQSYDFGPTPDYVVLHHTYNPCTRQAPANIPTQRIWDDGEAGMSVDQIKQKRKRSLDNLRNYYRDNLGWSIGPHLFIDDRFIWLFTPMNMPGAHAVANPKTGLVGNGYKAGGKLHYSIGIEVVGDYTRVQWPDAVARLVGDAVVTLQRRLGTFELRYQPGAGGISSHRDYNKPACPGNAVTNQFYMDVIAAAASRANTSTLQGGAGAAPQPATTAPANRLAPAGASFTENSSIFGPPSASPERVLAYMMSRPHGEYTEADIRDSIIPAYFAVCTSVGVDPVIAIAQMIHETDNLSSFWAARPQRNPAGIGVNGRFQADRPADANGWALNTQRQRWEMGLSFASWKDQSVIAHVGRLLAYALPAGGGDPQQQALIARALGFRPLPDKLRGSAPTLKPLGKAHNPAGDGWASPGDRYGVSIADLAQRIAAG
jgi:hypothetical protein